MLAIRTLATILTYAIGLCGVIPLFPWLVPFPRGVLVAGLIAGIWQDRRGIWLFRPWMQNSTIVPLFVYYALQFSRSNPVEPVTSVLAVMLAVRISGEKTVRHSLQIYAIATFCLAASSLFDLSPLFLVYLALLLVIVAVALVLLTFQDQDRTMLVAVADLRRILCSALLMPVLSFPLLLLFFPLIPRTQMPLWNFLTPPSSRTTGYSETVEPGSQSSISESRTLAFRAEMSSQPESQLYWRGTVLSHTDGTRWTRAARIPSERIEVRVPSVTQLIYPEPSAVRSLVALDRPVTISQLRVKRYPDGVFESIGAAGRRISYSADSRPGGVVSQLNAVNRQFYLQLPDHLPAGISELSARIFSGGKDDRSRLDKLEQYFRNGGYRYATRNMPTGGSAVEQFLVRSKQGNCEFFASSFALLLRTSGVPCRLVGGYLGGEYNRLGGYYLVTDDRAHVWVEAFIEGSGWLRVDPSRFAANSSEVWRSGTPFSMMQYVTMLFDSLNHSWNRSVITYDFDQQMKLMIRVTSGLQNFAPADVLRRSLPYAAGVLLSVAIFFAAGRTPVLRSREKRILKRFLDRVEREFGIETHEGREGLFEIASRFGDGDVADFVRIYAGAVYRDRRLTDEEYSRLREILRTLNGRGSKRP